MENQLRQWFKKKLQSKGLFAQVLRKARRFYVGTFYPGYVQQSIEASRQGDCHRCGSCCELVYKCPFLGRDSQSLPYCRVYGELRPVNCRNYPFDALDSEIAACGFKFPDKASPTL